MNDRIQKEDLIRSASERTGVDSEVTTIVVDAFLDEIYQSLKHGQPVTIRDFGSFYVREERARWVFRFNPSQKWRSLFGWSSTYRGEL